LLLGYHFIWDFLNTKTMEKEIRKILFENLGYGDANKAVNELLALFGVTDKIIAEYAEFCVRCDREGLPLICLEDYIKQYCR